jgi:23S rRNA (cytosine1962-C5)-methyltransferase
LLAVNNINMKNSNILITESSPDYELLDTGLGEKLERIGKFVLSRPDPQALWAKRLPDSEWKKADASFSRDESKGDAGSKSGWTMKTNIPDRWSIDFGEMKFQIKPTAFKHVGLFPEQVVNWKWLGEIVNSEKCKMKSETKNLDDKVNDDTDNHVEVLNLFGYTGGASLACAKAGAKVVHVDGSKSAITWARENAELSGLKDKPVRWILEDARAFVTREIKRDRKYDGIIMDPPAFGHGPDNELWKIEEHFLGLVQDCVKLLKNKPSFFLINGYSAGYSAIAYENILLSLVEKFGGSIETGELAISESKKAGLPTRLLPCGIFARWNS